MPATSMKRPSATNRMPPTFTRTSLDASSQDVVRREQADPNDVHEVPVQRGRLHAGVLLRRELAAEGLQHHQVQEEGTTEHVGEVEPGHRVEQRGEDAVTKSEAQLRVVE